MDEAGLGRVALLGTGLIGGSLAAGLKRHRLASRIIGYAAGDDASDALALGLLDEVAASPEQAVTGCDAVILAAPVSINCTLLGRIAPSLSPGVLLTDVSSVKMPVVAAARHHLGDALGGFVPSHPIAGSERSGPRAADARLFEERTVILSPLPQTCASQTARLEAIWQRLGAVVLRLDPEEHDRIYAIVSHWPHAMAFALAATVSQQGVTGSLVGQGLLDLTRTAAAAPELWADILLQNAVPVLRAAEQVGEATDAIRNAVAEGDRSALIRMFSRAAEWRRGLG